MTDKKRPKKVLYLFQNRTNSPKSPFDELEDGSFPEDTDVLRMLDELEHKYCEVSFAEQMADETADSGDGATPAVSDDSFAVVSKEENVLQEFASSSQDAWESALLGAGDEGLGAFFGESDEPLGALLGDENEGLAQLVRLFSSSSGDTGEHAGMLPDRLVSLDAIMNRCAGAIARRLHLLIAQEWSVTVSSRINTTFSEWKDLENPVSSYVQLNPLPGVVMFCMDAPLSKALGIGGIERGNAFAVTDEDQKHSPVLEALGAYFLRLFQLDVEWGFAPYYEVETRRKRVLAPQDVERENLFETPCVWTQFLVTSPAGEGEIALGIPAITLQPIVPDLQSGVPLVVPDEAEWVENSISRYRSLSDEEMVAMFEREHPHSATVVLGQLDEPRRKRLLELLKPELKNELVRRLGHRKAMQRVLSKEHQHVVATLALGEEFAASMLRNYTPQAAARFLSAVATMPTLYPAEVERIVQRFQPHARCAMSLVPGGALVRRLMMRGVSAENVAEVAGLLEGVHLPLSFGFLLYVQQDALVDFLGDESVAVAAVVFEQLCRLSAERAARVLELLPLLRQAAIMERVTVRGSINPNLFCVLELAVAATLPADAKALPAFEPACGGFTTATVAQCVWGKLADSTKEKLKRFSKEHGVSLPV